MAKSKKKKGFLQEIVEEEQVVEEEVTPEPEPQLLQEEPQKPAGKMSKQEFLDSVGMGHRPNSQRSISAWEEYQAS